MNTKNEERAKLDFANNLRFVEIELFAFCNRKCWFCPNSEIDRITNKSVMSNAMYENVLAQLAEISFSGELAFSRYNEPLAKKSLFLERLTMARKYLPTAKLRTNTNGDYLDADYVGELRNAGLNELFVQQYLGNDEPYDHSRIKSEIYKMAKNLGFSYSVISDLCDQRFEINLNTVGMTVHVRGRNFELEGSGRTDKVKKAISDGYVRTKSCPQPFHNMYVDYNGNVMVCCNARSDMPEHSDGLMGNVGENKLWEIFSSDRYSSWRLHLADDGVKNGMCSTCKIGLPINEFLV